MSLEHMKVSLLVRVVVEKKGIYYSCQLFAGKVKCGSCQFGLINPFAVKYQDDKCRRCGANLVETVTGSLRETMESYRP